MRSTSEMKIEPVRGIAGGRSRQDVKIRDTDLVAKPAEANQRLKRDAFGLLAQPARRGKTAAETCKHLLVEQNRGRPRQTLVNDQADRVRSDVDHRNGPVPFNRPRTMPSGSLSATLHGLRDGLRAVCSQRLATA